MRHISQWLFVVLLATVLGCQAEQEPPAGDSDVPKEVRETAASGGDSAAKTQQQYQAGTHYQVLPEKVPTATGGKIEVAEVFWYGCSHCYTFEPLLEEWSQTLPDNVVVVRSPAMWDRQGIMERHARIYYTAKALGELDDIHEATFKAMHLKNKPLRSEDAIAELFEEHGVSREKFEKTFNSFGVTSAVRQAEARQRSYRIQGTPEIIVDGQYRITARMTGGHEGMLRVAEYLIEKESNDGAGNN